MTFQKINQETGYFDSRLVQRHRTYDYTYALVSNLVVHLFHLEKNKIIIKLVRKLPWWNYTNFSVNLPNVNVEYIGQVLIELWRPITFEPIHLFNSFYTPYGLSHRLE